MSCAILNIMIMPAIFVGLICYQLCSVNGIITFCFDNVAIKVQIVNRILFFVLHEIRFEMRQLCICFHLFR